MTPSTPIPEINEAFHRHKKSMLIFTAAALVLSLVHTEGEAAISTIGGAVKIDQVTAWFLLWAAAIYYALGFASEAVTAWRHHSEFMVAHGERGTEMAINRLIERVGTVDGMLEKQQNMAQMVTDAAQAVSVEVFAETASELRALLERMKQDEELQKIAATDPARYIAVNHQHLNAISSNIGKFQHQFELAVRAVSERIQLFSGVRNALGTLPDQLKSLRGDLARLSPQLAWERRITLAGWEITAPVAFLAVATVVGLPELTAVGRRAAFLWPVTVEWAADIRCAAQTGQAECSGNASPPSQIEAENRKASAGEPAGASNAVTGSSTNRGGPTD